MKTMEVRNLHNTVLLLACICLAFLVSACSTSREAPISGFKPSSPQQRLITYYEPFRSQAPEPDWSEVDSVQPTLAWEPFPGIHQGEKILLGPSPKDIARNTDPEPVNISGHASLSWPFVEVDLDRVSDVTYELAIWEAEGNARGNLVYEAEGIEDTRHRVATSLEPSTNYLWTIRARFRLDGEPRVTEWSMIVDYYCLYYWASGISRTVEGCYSVFHGPICAPRYLARQLGTVPSIFLYRFKTPDG